MPKYIKLYSQFLGFVHSLDTTVLSTNEKKLINLLIRHFDSIKEKGTQSGLRSKHIYSLIEAQGESIPSEITIPDTNVQETDIDIKRLKSLDLEHFRGFADKETFVLSKQFTFVYGPNGSGKSSLFEALEYSMLGFIQGAIDKNIDIPKYIKNHFSGQQVNPILYGYTDETSADVVKPNAKYAFCFIEKSRIDRFARISANTEKEREKHLATLFGLDEFSKFVNDFNREADKYFQVEKKKEKDFADKIAAIERTKTSVAEEYARLETHKTALQTLITNAGCESAQAFEELYVKAPEGKKTKLDELTEQLKAAAPKLLTFPTIADIQTNIDSVAETFTSLTNSLKTLLERKSEIQFKDLFQSALAVETPDPQICPLCETPINQVHIDPFNNARSKLEKLQEVMRLETQAESTYATLYDMVVGLDGLITSLNCALTTSGRTGLSFVSNEPLEKNKEDTQPVLQRFQEIQTSFTSGRKDLDAEQTHLNALNETIKAEIETRKTLETALNAVQSIKENHGKESALLASSEARITAGEKEISEFDKKNAAFIAEIQSENERVERNKVWLAAYHHIVELLSTYMDSLPIQYVGELSGATCDIFNHINKMDRDYEKAVSITLPKSTDDAITIKYSGSPTEEYNALCILSEGHLRCLGLAILIAKNIKEGCPALIFDDVVNAIDSEHRGGIRDLLFHYEPLQGKQVIITTHDVDFVSKLVGKISGDSVKEMVQEYNFNTEETSRRILVNRESRNYLLNAFVQYSKNEIFEAMKIGRLALESIGYELWRKLSKQQRTLIPGNYPTGKPDLNSLISGLNKSIKENKIEKFKGVCEHFDYFLKPDIWKYFNMASHEGDDRPQLDKDVIREILDKCALVDGMLKVGKAPKPEPPKAIPLPVANTTQIPPNTKDQLTLL
jgi:AAA15 family ATPase/GTPase/ABC-type dipeptide/oligopeptide/nickel transport system ATPase component